MLKSDLHSSSIASLSAENRRTILAELSEDEALALLYDWPFWAREKQLAPDWNWHVWLILAGRGFGKTRTGAEMVRHWAESGVRYIGLLGATASDVRDVMIEGESGIMAISPPWFMPNYEPSKRRLTWPNGAIAITRSADEPNRLRGPQYEKGWCDELAAWRYPESWDQFLFGLRLGDNPQVVVTTTPRPTKLIRSLVKDRLTALTAGNTFENAANIAPSFLTDLKRKYEGTRLGRQELEAIILDDTPGALWTMKTIDDLRVTQHPDLKRIVVAIDPSTTSDEDSAEAGIIVAGVGVNGHGYVLDDFSLRDTPAKWALEAITAYHKFEADRIIGEANNGGDMIEQVLKSVLDKGERLPPYTKVHASRGKLTRAEPVSALYEQGLIHHVGSFAELEDQMTTYVPGEKSPDRMDALVWAFTELMVDGSKLGMSKGKAQGLYPERQGRKSRRRQAL
jgi:phage terminase large subunit-like protein